MIAMSGRTMMKDVMAQLIRNGAVKSIPMVICGSVVRERVLMRWVVLKASMKLILNDQRRAQEIILMTRRKKTKMKMNLTVKIMRMWNKSDEAQYCS